MEENLQTAILGGQGSLGPNKKYADNSVQHNTNRRGEAAYNPASEFKSDSIASILEPLTNNVEKHINRIRWYSIVHFITAAVLTILAIVIIAYKIMPLTPITGMKNLLIHLLPRTAIATPMLLLAFFILRLYKSNLEETKYFQNELTNLTAISSAIRLSHLIGDTEKVYELIKNLAATERNFRLKKEETTVGLETAKLENEVDKQIPEQLANLFAKINTDKQK